MDVGPLQRWAASGAMALTGSADDALGPPTGLVEGIHRLGGRFDALDALALLGERAALMGLWRRGRTSCGGSCRLLRCADGFHDLVEIGRMQMARDEGERFQRVEQWRQHGHDVVHHGFAHRLVPEFNEAAAP